ncbi:hypothetical protein [Duganella sp. LjRoot269]|jgi:hypothetical protein|uniref:hypothetical protein n=1 Tax=Duganella sp. LjRoot269 TaxID=3342305 RepID=UPI003ECF976F
MQRMPVSAQHRPYPDTLERIGHGSSSVSGLGRCAHRRAHICAHRIAAIAGRTRTFRQSARGVVYNAVKNGQLLWIVTAMSSEGCYELAGYLESAASNWRELAWTGLGFHVFLIVMSAVLVMLGAIDGLNESADMKDEAVEDNATINFGSHGFCIYLRRSPLSHR